MYPAKTREHLLEVGPYESGKMFAKLHRDSPSDPWQSDRSSQDADALSRTIFWL